MSAKKPWYRRRWPRSILISVVALVALLLGAQWWLGTAVGRGLVETRLSAALGRPVQLQGNFRLGLLPVAGVSGTGLRILTRDGLWPVLEAQDYRVRLALRPLFNGEIEIVALEVSAAGIDLARLNAEPSPPARTQSDFFQLPDIQNFDLSEGTLYLEALGQPPYLRISRLSLEQFELGSAAPFTAGLAYVTDDGELLAIDARGEIMLLARGFVEVGLERLGLELEDWEIQNLQGQASFDLLTSVVETELHWRQAENNLSAAARVDLKPPFAAAQNGYLVDKLNLALGQETLAGRGCLINAAPPELHLALSAASLDIDALAEILQGWQRESASSAQGRGLASAEGPDSMELPFALSLQLEVQSARYQGAVAEGVRLLVGEAPACPR